MKNYLRQFVAWAIGLRDDPFVRARIKLTFLYAVSIIIVFGVSYYILNSLWVGELSSHFGSQVASTNSSISPNLVNSITSELSQKTKLVMSLVAFVIITINFFVAGQTLAPIRQIVRAQKRFIADASHELRTPLAIMKTNSEVALLDGNNINPKDARDVLKSTVEEIDRMSSIIENLLRLSYYENKVTEIPFSPINLSDVVKNITTKAQSLALKKSVYLKLTRTEPGIILGNPTALEQMIMNLIKNAVTYTPKNGAVSVSVVNKNRSMIELQISDTGIGISEKDLPHVFYPFYKAGTDRRQEEGSSGLGLTIVKKIVDRHRGEISVTSHLGKGTVFSVHLPRLQVLE